MVVDIGGACLRSRTHAAQDFQPHSLTDPTSYPINVPEPEATQAVQPFGPVEPGTVEGGQLFAPADLSEYGNFPRPNYGPWIQYDRIYWSTHQPGTVPIGNPNVLPGTNSLDTSFMDAAFQWGNRYELGYMLDDDTGWMTSILKTNYQQNSLNAQPFAVVGFIDTSNANAATAESFANLRLHNLERMAGIELDKVYRYPVGDHGGGIWEVFFGPRFFQFHDRFDATANTFIAGVPQAWDLGITNNIVGPQLGFAQDTHERWTFITEIRGVAGVNFENASEYGWLGVSSTTPLRPASVFNSTSDVVRFAPYGELRVETQFQVTKACSLRVGYTAIGGTGIGRASDRIGYFLPNMTILDGDKSNSFFTNGLTFGIEFNR